jgi:hypothetical protein
MVMRPCAMMILSGGRDPGKTMAAEPFSAQHHAARGFFVSLHELFSSYPTLSKRVSDLLDLRNDRVTPRPSRNPLAYLLALGCPGARYGVIGVVITFYLVFIFAGIGLPLFTKARERAQALQHHRQQSLEQSDEDARPAH